MEFLQKAQGVAGLVVIVSRLEAGDEAAVTLQNDFFQSEDGVLTGILEHITGTSTGASAVAPGAEGMAQALWVLVRLCRRAMGKETSCAANLDVVGSESCMKGVFGALEANHKLLGEPDVALACSWLIMVLASDSAERQSRLASCGAIDVLALLFAHFKSSAAYPKVSEFATRACRNMAANDEVAHQLVEGGLCEALVDVARTYTAVLVEVDLKRSTTNLAGMLSDEFETTDDGESKVQVCYEVLEATMWAALNLTCQEDIATIFNSVQGIDVCLDALRVLSTVYARKEGLSRGGAVATGEQHPSEPAVGAIVCVLRNLTFTSDQSKYNYSLINHSPIVEILFECMDIYQDSFDVNDSCLWAIVNLAEEKNMAAKLMSSNVVDVLIRTVSVLSVNYRKISDEKIETRDQRHFRTGPIAEAVIWATKRFAAIDIEYALEFGRKGIIEVFAACMVEYLHRDGMIMSICDCLAALTFKIRQTEEEVSMPIIHNITRTVNSGALKSIVAAFVQHQGPVASQLSEMHEPAIVVLAKTVEEMSRYLNRSSSSSDSSDDGAALKEEEGDGYSKPSNDDLRAAREMLTSMQIRDSPTNVFIPIITTMKEHATSGDIARSAVQLLLDLYYISPEERKAIQEKGLFDPAYGKAAPYGNTVEEVMKAWGVAEIERLWGPPPKEKEEGKSEGQSDSDSLSSTPGNSGAPSPEKPSPEKAED